MVHLDIEYSQRSSLGLDLKIIFKTVPALVIQCLDQRASSASRKRQNVDSSASAAVAKPVRPLHV
jgi:lipopolysaccharide/colanic/teichoic acid biosynthesis glycosyltransferase